jgi:hypothetical protein
MKKFVKSIEKRMLQQKNSILTRCCKIIKNNFAQHLLEYALVIALVAAAAIAMRTYVQRAAQGSIKMVENEAFKDPLEGINSYKGESSGISNIPATPCSKEGESCAYANEWCCPFGNGGIFSGLYCQNGTTCQPCIGKGWYCGSSNPTPCCPSTSCQGSGSFLSTCQ